MENLKNISDGYLDLFLKTNKVEFFVLSKNCLKLYNDIALTASDEQTEQNDLTL